MTSDGAGSPRGNPAAGRPSRALNSLLRKPGSVAQLVDRIEMFRRPAVSWKLRQAARAVTAGRGADSADSEAGTVNPSVVVR